MVLNIKSKKYGNVLIEKEKIQFIGDYAVVTAKVLDGIFFTLGVINKQYEEVEIKGLEFNLQINNIMIIREGEFIVQFKDGNNKSPNFIHLIIINDKLSYCRKKLGNIRNTIMPNIMIVSNKYGEYLYDVNNFQQISDYYTKIGDFKEEILGNFKEYIAKVTDKIEVLEINKSTNIMFFINCYGKIVSHYCIELDNTIKLNNLDYKLVKADTYERLIDNHIELGKQLQMIRKRVPILWANASNR